MYKIHFDREKKSLVDEVNDTFYGTRVSDVVSTTRYESLDHDWAEERALEKALAKAGEYNADAYEIISLESKSNVGGGSRIYLDTTVSVIFYQSTSTPKKEE